MLKNRNEIKTKLHELGEIVGLEKSETEQAKRTTKNLICVFIAVGIFALISLFLVSRMDPVGLWYMPPSIKDFNLLGRLL